jgi:hypothetical protein
MSRLAPAHRPPEILRSAISPWLDRRQTVDLIRDKLEARGLALLRQPELIA